MNIDEISLIKVDNSFRREQEFNFFKHDLFQCFSSYSFVRSVLNLKKTHFYRAIQLSHDFKLTYSGIFFRRLVFKYYKIKFFPVFFFYNLFTLSISLQISAVCMKTLYSASLGKGDYNSFKCSFPRGDTSGNTLTTIQKSQINFNQNNK